MQLDSESSAIESANDTKRMRPSSTLGSSRSGWAPIVARIVAGRARQASVPGVSLWVVVYAWIDQAFARAMSPSRRLYADGFGDRARLESLVDEVRELGASPPDAIDIRWSRPRTRMGFAVSRGRYRSPARFLPPESVEGVVERWLPNARAPHCLILATTGEEGFANRRPLAMYLAHKGIASVIVENPYYGARRPEGQIGAAVRTVADQFAMNTATVKEVRSLLAYFAAHDLEVGATGFSQGGMMAAFGAALSDFPVAVTPRGAACRAESVFTRAALATTMRWDVLAAEAGSREAAERYFAECLEPVRVDRLPPPVAPHKAILVASRHDGFIPPSEAEALHAAWPGSELRWVSAGHVTGLVLRHPTHRRAILDAFARR